MDLFQDGHHVRLRNRVHGTYLHADEDGHGVSLSPSRASMRVAWRVHLYYADDHQVLLQSAAYGSYLSATNASAPLGCLGFRVAQRHYEELEDEAIRWQPFTTGGDIMLRHVCDGGRLAYLRGNGKYRIWNESIVTVDRFHNVGSMIEWVVEPIPSRARMPLLPRPPKLDLSVLWTSRVIMGNGEGCRATDVSFRFRGRSVFRLRNKLINRLGISPNVSDNLVMYVRAGRYGRFTPLVVDLPGSTQTLVIRTETPADGGLLYPDVDAA